MSKAIEKVQSGGVPALYTPPPMEIDSDDIQIPAIKFGHHQSELCQEHNIKLGVIYAAAGKDDPDPQILWDPAERGENPGVLFHVLGLRKGKSKMVDGDLTRWDFHDADAPSDADKTYTFTLLLPEVDTEIPFRTTLYRSKAAMARTILTVVQKNQGRVPQYALAFRMTTVNKKKEGIGSWTVPQARMVEANPEHVALAGRCAEMVAARPEPIVVADSPDI
jgi:hypothetical protein